MFVGDIAGAREQWRRVFPDAMVALSFSQAVKAGLLLRGEPVGSPREPLPDPPPEGVSRLENALARLNK